MQLTLTFSHPIRFNAVNDPANWFIRVSNQLRTGLSVSVGPAVVVISSSGVVPSLGPPIVNYSPPPFDVISDTVRPTPAPAFAGFPVT